MLLLACALVWILISNVFGFCESMGMVDFGLRFP